MKNNSGDYARINHILDAISEIENYVKDKNYSQFKSSSLIRFASVKQLEIIGESANHLSDNLKKQTNNIPWEIIIGLRNFLVHEYFGIDAEITWAIIKNDLPELKKSIKSLLAENTQIIQ
ncbi:DUF86 domain-containing protein [Candidatus Margulisiibacteriota bacterium]